MGRSAQLAPLAATIAALEAPERRTLEDGTDVLERLLRDPSRIRRVALGVTVPTVPVGNAAPPRRASEATAARTARSELMATRIALVVALVCLLQPGLPAQAALLAAIVIVGVLVASARWRVGRLAVLVLLRDRESHCGSRPRGFSDVLIVTEAAIREMLAGGNPYGHGFEASVPPGAPFPYGPLALLWYLPALDDLGSMERFASFTVLVALAVRGRPLGLAIYAVMPALVATVSDGSNDHSAGLLLLVALLTALRWPIGGAVLLALVTAFKPYALAWLPGIIGYAGIAPLVAFVAASVVAWLLPALAWGPGAMLWSFRQADAIHAQPYYSLAYAMGGDRLPQPVWQGLRLVARCPARHHRPALGALGSVLHRPWDARLRGHAFPRLVGHLCLFRRRCTRPLLAS